MWDTLKEINAVSITIRLILAALLGGVLGFAREKKGRPAGLRTYMVVCISSALIMVTNEYMSNQYEGVDVSRMGAQILSGIGFLGAGTIIITGRNKVKGLTTAAGLWAAACLGLAVGTGFYFGAILGGILILVIMECLYWVDSSVFKHAKVITIYIEFEMLSQFREFITRMNRDNVRISDMEMKKDKEIVDKGMAAIVTLHYPTKIEHSVILHQMMDYEGIVFVEEV